MVKLPKNEKDQLSNPAHLKGTINVVSIPQANDGLSTDGNSEIFSYSELLRRLMGDKDVVKTVLYTYLEDAPDQVNLLKSLLESRSYKDAGRQAHKLKGAAANIDAQNLKQLLNYIENQCKKDVVHLEKETLKDLDAQFVNLLASIEQHLSKI